MGRFDLGALEIVAAVVREGTLTGAAVALGTSQPAVSYQLRRIETALGQSLFDRSPAGCRLTPAGELLWRAAGPAYDRIGAAVEDVVTLGRGAVLRVRTDFGFAGFWLMSRLGAFRAAEPELEVQILASQFPARPRPDEVSVRFARAGAVEPGARLLMPEVVVPVTAPGAPGPDDGARLLHLVAAPEAAWMTWDDWFTASGRIRHAAHGDLWLTSYDLVIQAAHGGEGVALGWLPLVEPQLRQGSLVAAGPELRRADRGYWLETGAGEGRLAARFADWLVATAEEEMKEIT